MGRTGNGIIAIRPRKARFKSRTGRSTTATTLKMRWWVSHSWPRMT
jgi:hypothetical protein